MYFQQGPLRLTILAAALAAALPALSQQVKQKPADPEIVQKVEVKGSVEAYDARREDTASKIVVNHEELVKFGDTNILDVLKRLPGVTVTGGDIRMRGLGNGYTQILLNGERAPAGFSMDSLAPDSIERIEVMRAATAEFSTQAIVGTINIVLKKAIKSAQRELKLTVGGAKDAVTPSYNLQMSDRKGQLSYSLSVNGVHSSFNRRPSSLEEFTDAAGAVTALKRSSFHENGSFDGFNLGPRLNWTFANGDTLTSQTFVNYGRFARKSEAVVTAVPSAAAGAYPYQAWDLTSVNFYYGTDLNWVRKLGDGAKLDLKVGAVVGATRNDSDDDGYTRQGGNHTLDNHVKARGTDRGYTSTGKYSTPIGSGHALAVGWDGGYNKRRDTRVQRERRYTVAPDMALPAYQDFPLNQEFTGEVTRTAAYMQDEWNITPRWSVYMGVRWEAITTAISDSEVPDNKARTSVWSPLLQTLYKLPGTTGDQLRFAITRTYKAPNVHSMIPRRFKSINNGPNEPDFVGNPDLKPELATGIDAAFEHYWGKGAMVSVSASMRRIAGFTRILLTEDKVSKIWTSTAINDGTATTRGLEFEAKFPLTSLLAKAPAVDVRFNMSRNWSSVSAVEGPNNRLDQQTPFSSTLGLDYKQGSLTTGTSYSFRNGGQVRVSNTHTSYAQPRRDLEIYALWKFNPNDQLRVAFTNILAQDFIGENNYTILDGTGGNAGALRRRTTTPVEAGVWVTMEMKF